MCVVHTLLCDVIGTGCHLQCRLCLCVYVLYKILTFHVLSVYDAMGLTLHVWCRVCVYIVCVLDVCVCVSVHMCL